jgi:hypothetical protein
LPAKSLNPHWLLSPSNWLHRNALLSGLGGWPPSDKYAADMILLKRMWKTRVKIGFQRQLSVLKFASGVWRNYVLKDEYPQSAYLEALTKNPEGLRRDLLQDIMTAASTSRVKFRRKQKPARALLRRTMILASNIYGIHRWPVNQLLRWLWRRDSGLNRKRR